MSKLFKKAGAIIGGVVGFMIGGPVGAAIGFGLGSTKVGDKLVNKVLDFVMKPFLGNLGMPTDTYSSQREEGVVITKRGGGTSSIPVVYGFRQVGGTITFATTGSDRNKYLWVAYVLSEGPVEGIHSLFIDDNDITDTNLIAALNRGEEYNINTGKYNGRVKMQFWYGKNFGVNAAGSPVGPHVFMREAPGWRTTDAYNGLATLFVRYEWKQVTTQDEANNNPFGGNIPNIKVNLLGRRVLPIDSTASTRNYIDDVNFNRERYSTNPAEIILDYLRNPWYGKGLKNSEIDWDSFAVARSKYNQDVTYVNGVRGPILTTNCVLDTDVTLMGNIKTLLQGCRSYLPYVQGKYKLKVEDAGNPTDITSGSALVVKTFTPDNIVGDISWGGVPRDSVYSEYEVTYVDPTNKWSTNTVTFPPTENERLAYKIIDGGRTNRGSATFPTLTNHAMAYDMARLLFLKSRRQETLNVTVNSEAFDLEPGDNVYVQGNILTFNIGPESVPWRIVSIKGNDDYTFDLGLVRNPDDIYPHTRARERDTVLPPYIPRYESIDYPITAEDLSLYPPSHGFTGGQPITSPLNPPGATDPTGGTGGGVGDANGDQNQNPITVAPPPAAPVREVFDHNISVDRVDYTVQNNLITATLQWRQPDSPSYAGVDFWYKRDINTETVFSVSTSTNIAGAGNIISHQITGLIQGSTPYIVYTRVRYTNGNSSISRTVLSLTVSSVVSTEYPQDTVSIVGPGWSLPIQPGPNPRDTTLASLSAVAELDLDGNRRLTFTVTQDINNPSGLNSAVNGLNIYYKPSSQTYYKIARSNFDGGYFPGQSYTLPVTMELGVGNPSPDDSSDNFDFIFRLKYNDGTESTNQWRYMNVDIQPTWNSNDEPNISETSAEFNILTEEQAPPDQANDTRNITIGLYEVGYIRSNPSQMYFRINAPAVEDRINWYGVRVRYRRIPPGGGDVAFDVVEEFPVRQPEAGIWQVVIGSSAQPIQYDPAEYQIILTPVVRYQGTRVESRSSWIGQGRLQRISENQFNNFNFRTIESAQIPGISSTPFPEPPQPKVMIRSWKKVRNNLNNPQVNNQYFELEYNASHISNLTAVRIYRRSNVGNSTGVNTAIHYGLGRWEYLDVVPEVNATTLSNGNVLVNLRFAVSPQEFSISHRIGTSIQPLENTGTPWSSGKKVITTENPEFLVVAVTSTGISQIGMLLPTIATNATTTTRLAEEASVNSFNGYTSGYLRDISGARLNVTGSAQWAGFSTATNNAYVAPTPTRGRAVI
jgi:hypothetical protein